MKIHFIAIGGAIMHSLAIELHKIGHIVSGSDDCIYNPAKTNLEKHNLLPQKEGWNPEAIDNEIDLIILGMHAKKDNPELLKSNSLGLKVVSFPEFIYNYSKNKKRVVISGSHGKTTISSMIIHVLKHSKINCDFIVGAKIDLIDNLVCLNENKIIIIEGDEYLTSPVDKKPKFLHYHPHILLISGIEWDHVNVFPSFNSYLGAFQNLTEQSKKRNAMIFYSKSDKNIFELLKGYKFCKSYEHKDYIIKKNKFEIVLEDKNIALNVFGKHNLENIEAARLVCSELGVDNNSFYKSIKSFKGARNRLKLLANYDNNSLVYRDFAHSPSKVLATINAVKDIYPKRYLISCMELHTSSSFDFNFLKQYSDTFKNTEELWIYVDPERNKKLGSKKITKKLMFSLINHSQLVFIDKKEVLVEMINSFEKKDKNLLLMSSGNFSNINLEIELEKN
ncbi:MAG: Mur ligase family protein [Bacteroidota bacterium]|nr:Mur ligase family protein [Bacteroidota bacterium]